MVISRATALRIGTLVIAVVTIVLIGLYYALPKIRYLQKESIQTTVEQTSLYSVSVVPMQLPFASGYGGIDELNGKLIIASRQGDVWVKDESDNYHKTAYRVPTNADEYESSAVAAEILERYRTGWSRRSHFRFGVKDILVIPGIEQITLYAVFTLWNEHEQCITLNVAYTQFSANGDPVKPNADWRSIFQSKPCLGLNAGEDFMWFEEAGGRLVNLGDRGLLLTVGDFGFAGMTSELKYLAQRGEYDYGKTILIDPVSGNLSHFTKGHRNPQGLATTATGQVYLTEHGPTGGDELNLLQEGENYGWPFVTYGRRGTEDSSTRAKENGPLDWTFGDHTGDYQLPMYSWVPSIGISNLISVRGELFDQWRDDLLVSSLRQKTIYRLRIREGRVIFAEPVVTLDTRIRDLVEMSDGTIYLRGDFNHLFQLTPDFSEQSIAIAQCSACHSFVEDQPDGIGPNLWEVTDRPIASRGNFRYSAALEAQTGVWDREQLKAFLQAPQDFAPGTTMTYAVGDPAEVDLIVDYLMSLQH